MNPAPSNTCRCVSDGEGELLRQEAELLAARQRRHDAELQEAAVLTRVRFLQTALQHLRHLDDPGAQCCSEGVAQQQHPLLQQLLIPPPDRKDPSPMSSLTHHSSNDGDDAALPPLNGAPVELLLPGRLPSGHPTVGNHDGLSRFLLPSDGLTPTNFLRYRRFNQLIASQLNMDCTGEVGLSDGVSEHRRHRPMNVETESNCFRGEPHTVKNQAPVIPAATSRGGLAILRSHPLPPTLESEIIKKEMKVEGVQEGSRQADATESKSELALDRSPTPTSSQEIESYFRNANTAAIQHRHLKRKRADVDLQQRLLAVTQRTYHNITDDGECIAHEPSAADLLALLDPVVERGTSALLASSHTTTKRRQAPKPIVESARGNHPDYDTIGGDLPGPKSFVRSRKRRMKAAAAASERSFPGEERKASQETPPQFWSIDFPFPED